MYIYIAKIKNIEDKIPDFTKLAINILLTLKYIRLKAK